MARLYSHVAKHADVRLSCPTRIQEAFWIPFSRVLTPDSREAALLSNPAAL